MGSVGGWLLCKRTSLTPFSGLFTFSALFEGACWLMIVSMRTRWTMMMNMRIVFWVAGSGQWVYAEMRDCTGLRAHREDGRKRGNCR